MKAEDYSSSIVGVPGSNGAGRVEVMIVVHGVELRGCPETSLKLELQISVHGRSPELCGCENCFRLDGLGLDITRGSARVE